MTRAPPDRKNRFVHYMLMYANDDSHGYSQKPPSGRWGPDYDCSSLIYQAAHDAGYPVGTGRDRVRFTGTMLKDFEGGTKIDPVRYRWIFHGVFLFTLLLMAIMPRKKGGSMRNLDLEISDENLEYLNEELSGPRNGGFQYWFSFPNGYAGSVVKGPYTYGGDMDLWELAVMNEKTMSVCYSTPITDDVLGYLTDDEVNHYLGQIKALPIK